MSYQYDPDYLYKADSFNAPSPAPPASDPAAIEAWLRAELERQPEADRFAWIGKVYDAIETLFGEAMGPAR